MGKRIEFDGKVRQKAVLHGAGKAIYEVVTDLPAPYLWEPSHTDYHIVMTPAEPEPEPTPEPLCPVCDKPASEHRDGLFCCGHCGAEAEYQYRKGERWRVSASIRARCTGCGIATCWFPYILGREVHRKRALLNTAEDWNRRT